MKHEPLNLLKLYLNKKNFDTVNISGMLFVFKKSFFLKILLKILRWLLKKEEVMILLNQKDFQQFPHHFSEKPCHLQEQPSNGDEQLFLQKLLARKESMNQKGNKEQ